MDKQKPQECPTPERLRGLLSGEFAVGAQDAVTQHIETCPSCQHTLDGWLSSPSIEGLAAGKDSATQEAALRELMDNIKKKSLGDMTQAEHSGSRDDSLSFLAPSAKAGHLGRLGQYEILHILGKGGFGTVFKAFDEKLHRVVAIKVLAPELAVSGTARKRFVREAQAAAAVKSDHIVAIYNVADEANPPYLVMELIDGISLEDRLKNEGSLELKEILRIGMQIAEGLAAAHKQGLIHRDIKPGNILLENGVQRVKITDFGLARAADDASVTQSGVIAGTPMFMSPEQAEGLPLDQRSDLFSLGSVLYVMCTGRAPFRANTTMAVLKRVCDEAPTPIREINPDVPDWLCAIVEKLQAKKVDERFGSSKEVAELLGKHLAEVQAHGRAGGVSPLIPKPQNHGPNTPRSPFLIAASLAAVALLAVLGVIFWPRGEVAPPEKNLVENKTPEEKKTPPVVIPVKHDNDEWVQLFNGKDLSGWKQTPGSKSWEIADGVLHVKKAVAAILSTKRTDFTNFHLRMEVFAEPLGSGIVEIRSADEVRSGYQISLARMSTQFAPGSIRRDTENGISRQANSKLTEPNQWYTLEIIARGNHLVTKVNGKVALDIVDDAGPILRGAISLINVPSSTPIKIRMIEIKELPPTPPAPKDEWVSLFNGKDLTGWKERQPGKWRVQDDILIGEGTADLDYSKPLGDFHCRIETKVNKAGFAALSFRGEHRTNGVVIVCNKYSNKTGSIGFAHDAKVNWPGPNKNEVVPADTWQTLDILVRGQQVRVQLNGKQVAEALVPELPHIGTLGLQATEAGTVFAIRKIEIKELPPTPVETQPFVVLAKAQRAETRHPTLAAAVAAAQSGDTIEIQGNGPFLMAPLSLGKNALTIRAGKGFVPHLKHQPTDPKSSDPLLRTEGPLVLEGLILERGVHPETKVWTPLSTVVHTKKAPFRMANCRVIGRRVFMGLMLSENPEAIVTNCEILGFDVCHGHVSILPSESSRIVLENNLVAGTWHGLGLHLNSKAFDSLDGASVRLSRNSIWANFALGLHSPIPADSPRLANPGKNRLRLEANSNLFMGKSLFLLGVNTPSVTLVDAPTWLTKQLALKDTENLYALEFHTLLTISPSARPSEKGLNTIGDLQDWHKLWGIAKSGSQIGTPAFEGGDVLARVLANSSGIPVENFRLAKGSPGQGVLPGGKDLGADVDLVGPGDAYERWKKTPAYQEWCKTTDTLLNR